MADSQLAGDGVCASRHGEVAGRIDTDGGLATATVEPVGGRTADLDGPVPGTGHYSVVSEVLVAGRCEQATYQCYRHR